MFANNTNCYRRAELTEAMEAEEAEKGLVSFLCPLNVIVFNDHCGFF